MLKYTSSAVCLVGADETRQHKLTLQLGPNSSELVGALLEPADVHITDIVAAATTASRGIEFVVSSQVCVLSLQVTALRLVGWFFPAALPL